MKVDMSQIAVAASIVLDNPVLEDRKYVDVVCHFRGEGRDVEFEDMWSQLELDMRAAWRKLAEADK